MLVDIDFHHVVVTHPFDNLNGWTVAIPAPGSFNPQHIRVASAPNIRPGDLVVASCTPRRHSDLTARTDRAKTVWYFAGDPTPQQHGARPYNPAHCDWCAHNRRYLLTPIDEGWVFLDGCTVYRPDDQLLVIPRELVPLAEAA